MSFPAGGPAPRAILPDYRRARPEPSFRSKVSMTDDNQGQARSRRGPGQRRIAGAADGKMVQAERALLNRRWHRPSHLTEKDRRQT